jgi:hypothetical protein
MSTIVTRSGKGSPLTHTEVDDNFTNLNTDKYQEGSAIGEVTPAAGTFTTLTATGQTSLGGAAGSEGLRVNSVASAVSWIEVSGDTSVYPNVKAAGAGSAVELRLSSKGGGTLSFFTNNLAQRQMAVSHTASAVNYVQVTGAATGGPPVISAQGSDSTIAMLFVAKGGQDHRFFSNTGSAEQFRVLHTAGTMANHGYATGAAAGASPVFGVRGTDTNIDLTLTPKGTGATVANGNFKMNSGYGSAATAYGCRAWVNFNGTGTVAIRGSGNVSSITDNGTGDYTVNFSTAMPDANYATNVSADGLSGAGYGYPSWIYPGGVAAGSVRVACGDLNSKDDEAIVCVSVHR